MLTAAINAVTISIQIGISASETKKNNKMPSHAKGGPLNAGRKEPTNPKIIAQIDRMIRMISMDYKLKCSDFSSISQV
jgi:hypothetical protein